MRQETDYKLPSNSRWMHKSGESVATWDFGSASDWFRLLIGQAPIVTASGPNGEARGHHAEGVTFAGHATAAAERCFRRCCAPLDSRRHALLRRRLRARSSQG